MTELDTPLASCHCGKPAKYLFESEPSCGASQCDWDIAGYLTYMTEKGY